ncbi:Uncharacterised protein [Mycobacterium tuberculosis]|uniref:Uncharacterized protein n=1 Tax=Mycobacterium tuberculosis TaxID=1773 RepID=A0A0T9DWG2_MYCTX|nr:Uncharacterised protein [Mycobacterium tuberculosis]CFE66075.1 Uncharacterised protein [Mycobacterium tuberculosis]CKS65106.1 Uncharacterised protein [Mycobacterium tuberculosis]CKS66406.1 Uncharacterised protein [Mycobacterium tuberculosis]CKS91279.1 Uncharacterised protein [Mycobacterium tuberculosis]
MLSGMVGKIWIGNTVMGPTPPLSSRPMGIAGMVDPPESPHRPS